MDVTLNSVSIVDEDGVANINFETTYDAEDNKAATMDDVNGITEMYIEDHTLYIGDKGFIQGHTLVI